MRLFLNKYLKRVNTTGPQALTAGQREQFRSEGWLVVRRLVGGAALGELDRTIARMLDGSARPDSPWAVYIESFGRRLLYTSIIILIVVLHTKYSKRQV